MSGKIGIGVITCNRNEFLVECINSISLEDIDCQCIVNDGERLPTDITDLPKIRKYFTFEHINNKGVGISKNEAIRYLVNSDCEHIFIIEDDIIIKNSNVFKEYIQHSVVSGIKHLMFGYHGPANKLNNQSKGSPNPRLTVEYNSDVSISLNYHCVGAFCYYHRSCFDAVGFFDEVYLNAFEHVDHSYMLAKEMLCTPYWWWPDVANSCELLDELECSEFSSTIRGRSDWESNIRKAVDYFEQKHKYQPAYLRPVPDLAQDDVIKILREIKNEKV